MAKLTERYEALIVFSVKPGDEAVAAAVEKVKNYIEENATKVEVDEWGKRKLAYDINREFEGHYVVFTFSSEPSFPVELNRVLGINEMVLRTLITLKGDCK